MVMFSGLVCVTRLVAFGSVSGTCLKDDPDGDDENDQQHQHHVHERRDIDVGHRHAFFFAA